MYWYDWSYNQKFIFLLIAKFEFRPSKEIEFEAYFIQIGFYEHFWNVIRILPFSEMDQPVTH